VDMWIRVGDGGGKKEGRGLLVAVPGGWDGLCSHRGHSCVNGRGLEEQSGGGTVA